MRAALPLGSAHHLCLAVRLLARSLTLQPCCRGRRYRLLGDKASFEKRGFDVQEAQLVAGKTPDQEGFGEEADGDW
jgi:hypothetical protein